MLSEAHRPPGGVFDRGDPEAPYGSRDWAQSVHWRAVAALNDATSAAEALERKVTALRTSGGYQHLTDASGQPFLFWEAYCTTPQPFGLGYALEAIEAIIHERQSVEARAAAPKALAEHGAVGKGRHRGAERTSIKRGAGAEYLTARIARDHPEILAAMRAGQYRSVRAAAVAAGLVPVRWSVPAHDVPSMAGYLRQRLTAAQRAALIAALQEA